MLPLLAESLALLPPGLRWGVTFSTYHTTLPAGLDCQWRCVVEGSPEAVAARRIPHNVVLDLCKPSGTAPASPYVEMARTGIWPLSTTETVPSRVSVCAPSTGLAPDQYAVTPPAPPPRPPAPYGPVRRKFNRKRALGLRLAIVGAALLLLVAVAAGIFLWTSGYLEVASQEPSGKAAVNPGRQGREKQAEDSKAKPKATASEDGKTPKKDPQNKGKPSKADDERQERERKAAQEKADNDRKAREENDRKEKERQEKERVAAEEKTRLEGLRTAMRRLPDEIDLPILEEEAPQRQSAVGNAEQPRPSPSKPAVISREGYTQVSGLQLKVLGKAAKLGGAIQFLLRPIEQTTKPGTDATSRRWNCFLDRSPRGGATDTGGGTLVGQFVIDKTGFVFRWNDDLKTNKGKVAEANQLRNFILSVSAPEVKERRFITLRKRMDVDPQPLKNLCQKGQQFFDLGAKDLVNLPEDESLIRVKWEFTDLPAGVDAVRWNPDDQDGRKAWFVVGKDLAKTKKMDPARSREVPQVHLRWAPERSKVGFAAECTGRLAKPFAVALGLLQQDIVQREEKIRILAEETGRQQSATRSLNSELRSLESWIKRLADDLQSEPTRPLVMHETPKDVVNRQKDLVARQRELPVKRAQLVGKQAELARSERALAGKQEEWKKSKDDLERVKDLCNLYFAFRDNARLCVTVAAVVKNDEDGSEHEVVIIGTTGTGKKQPGGPPTKRAAQGAARPGG